MLKNILIISLILMTSAFAGQSNKNKEEVEKFNNLYNEYHDLYNNSPDIEKTYRVAGELYQLARQTFGKYSYESAEVTYNLARLINDASEKQFSAEAMAATALYKEYFDILDTIDAPQNKEYLHRFIEYVNVETSSILIFFSNRNLKKAEKLYKKTKLKNDEKADIEYNLASIYARLYNDKKARSYYNKSIKNYSKEYGEGHPSVFSPMIELINLDLKKIDSHISKAQDGIMNDSKNTEKREIRKAKKEFKTLSKKYEKTTTFIHQYDIPETIKLDLSLLQERYEDYQYKFNNFAYSENVYEAVEYEDDTTPPRSSITNLTPIERNNPKYPTNAHRKGLEGYVILKFDLGKDGKTKNIRLIETTHDIFVRNALIAASKYLYETPMQGDNPIEVKNIRVRIVFALNKKKEGEAI